MKHETKLLTVSQAAEQLGFKPRTISRWCREGKIIGAKKMGRVWRIETQRGRVITWPEN